MICLAWLSWSFPHLRASKLTRKCCSISPVTCCIPTLDICSHISTRTRSLGSILSVESELDFYEVWPVDWWTNKDGKFDENTLCICFHIFPHGQPINPPAQTDTQHSASYGRISVSCIQGKRSRPKWPEVKAVRSRTSSRSLLNISWCGELNHRGLLYPPMARQSKVWISTHFCNNQKCHLTESLVCSCLYFLRKFCKMLSVASHGHYGYGHWWCTGAIFAL